MKVSEIIEITNEAIRAKCMNIDVMISGLAQPVYVVDRESEREFPAVLIDGEDYHVFIDDDYCFGLYHKLNGKAYETDYKQGYGSQPKEVVKHDLSLICWGFTRFAAAESVERMFVSAMGKNVQVVKTDFDKKRVFSSEFGGVAFHIPEDVFLFKMNYIVKTDFKRECLELDEVFNT